MQKRFFLKRIKRGNAKPFVKQTTLTNGSLRIEIIDVVTLLGDRYTADYATANKSEKGKTRKVVLIDAFSLIRDATFEYMRTIVSSAPYKKGSANFK